MPPARQFAGELYGRVVPALQQTVAVRRHEGEQLDFGPRHGVDDERRSVGGEAAQAALLPAADDATNRVVVLDGGTRGREREPPSRALAAARDVPHRRRAAARAERRHDGRQSVPTAAAELRPWSPAREAALREEEVEQAPTLAGKA